MGTLKVWNGSAWEYASSAQVPSESFAVAATATNISTTSLVDITGLTITLTSPGPTAVYMVDASLDLTQNGVQASAVFTAQLVIDASVQTAQIVYWPNVSGARSACAKRWRITGLAAGSHTFKMQAALTAASANAYTVNGLHSVMEVNRTAVPGSSVDYVTEYISTQPASPTTGVTTFTRYKARKMPAFVDNFGLDTPLQPAFFTNRVVMVQAIDNSTTPDLRALTVTHLNNATATPAAVAMAATNFFTAMVRYRCSTTTSAGTGAGTRTTAQWHYSATANKGGFFFVCRFGLNLVAAGSRAFIGLSTTTTALSPTVDPSTLLSEIGFGFDAADANFQFMTNKSSGTATKTDMGASFAKGTGGTNFYEVRIFVAPGNTSTINYSIERINDGVVTNGSTTFSTGPAVDTLMAAHVHLSNGAVAAAHSVDIQSLYIETDN